jgi:cell division protein ZapA
MAQVSININDQNYTITCDDGQEDRLRELAAYFDTHVRRMSEQVGSIADSRLMLLAGLTICDELKETQARIRQMEDGTGMTSEEGATRVINTATHKVREIANRLEEATGVS